MEVRLFGELEAADGGVALAVRGVRQRALLALLALCRDHPLRERLWELLILSLYRSGRPGES